MIYLIYDCNCIFSFSVRPNIDITVDCGSEEVKLYCYVPRIRPTPTAVFWKLDDEEVEGENTFGMVDADYDVSSAWANITYDVDDGQMESAQCVVRAGGQEWSKDARGRVHDDWVMTSWHGNAVRITCPLQSWSMGCHLKTQQYGA